MSPVVFLNGTPDGRCRAGALARHAKTHSCAPPTVCSERAGSVVGHASRDERDQATRDDETDEDVP